MQQQPPDGAEHQQRDLSRLPQPGELRRRLGPLSDRHRDGGRPHPADRDVGREGGRLRQRGAAHPFLAPARQRAGRGALRPVAVDGVLEALHHRRGLAGGDPRRKAPEYRGKTLYDVLFANGEANKFPLSEIDPAYENHEVKALRLLRPEGPVRGVRRLRPRPRPRPRAVRHLSPGARACAGRWSTARRRCGATARATTPMSRREPGCSSTATPTRRRTSSRAPYEPPAEIAGRGVRPLARHRAACWSTGIPAR